MELKSKLDDDDEEDETTKSSITKRDIEDQKNVPIVADSLENLPEMNNTVYTIIGRLTQIREDINNIYNNKDKVILF